jgi:hypothetical protein
LRAANRPGDVIDDLGVLLSVPSAADAEFEADGGRNQVVAALDFEAG